MDGPVPERSSLAGCAARAAAAAVDFALLYAALRAIEAVLLAVGVYIPFEATYLAAYVVASFLLLGWTGTTPGKWLCGIALRTRSGSRVGFGRAALREIVGKPLAVIPLLAGFFLANTATMRGPGAILMLAGVLVLVGFMWSAMHNRISGTVVVRRTGWRWAGGAGAAGHRFRAGGERQIRGLFPGFPERGLPGRLSGLSGGVSRQRRLLRDYRAVSGADGPPAAGAAAP